MPVPTSVQQMALTRDLGPGGFMERALAILMVVAGKVLTESGQTPYHQGRALYAQRVVANPLVAIQAGAALIVMGDAIVTDTAYDETRHTSECTVSDDKLEDRIAALWNALGGLDTPVA